MSLGVTLHVLDRSRGPFSGLHTALGRFRRGTLKIMVIIRSPFSDIEIPSKSIPDFLFDRKLPCAESKPFVTDATTGASHSFGQVRSLSRRFGQGLVRNRNWKKTDVLCIFSFNVIAFPVVLFGCQLAQGIVTPANPSYTSEELVHQLRDSGARAIVSHPELLSVAKSAAEAVGIQSRDIFCFGGTPVAGVEPWESLLSDSEIAFPGKSIDPAKDLGFLVYSSGTTGLAKGVMLSHRNIVSNILMNNAVEGINLDENTVMAAVLPFYHIFGLTCILQLCCYKGYGLVVHSKFDLENFLRSVQKYKITFAHLVPPIILRLAKDEMVDNYDLSSMKMINSGAAPLSATLVEEASGRIKIPIKQGYGLTETSPTTNTQKWSEWKETVGSVGYLVPNMEAKIVSDDGKELGAGETGEIWFKGPNIMLGYLNNEKATKNAITPDGYFKTAYTFSARKHTTNCCRAMLVTLMSVEICTLRIE